MDQTWVSVRIWGTLFFVDAAAMGLVDYTPWLGKSLVRLPANFIALAGNGVNGFAQCGGTRCFLIVWSLRSGRLVLRGALLAGSHVSVILRFAQRRTRSNHRMK